MSTVAAVIREAFAGKPYSEGKEAAIAAALRDAQADVVALVAVGRALIEAGLDALRAKASAGRVLLGDPGYYGRFGFRRSERLRASGLPAEYVLVRPVEQSEPAGILAFRPAFTVAD